MSQTRPSDLMCFHTLLLLVLMSNAGDSKPADIAILNLQKNSTIQVQTQPDRRLLDLDDFHYMLTPVKDHTSDNKSFLVFLVHSAPDHFDQRRIIRETWGSTRVVQDRAIRVVFLLGQTRQTLADASEVKVDNNFEISDHKIFETFEEVTRPHLSIYERPDNVRVEELDLQSEIKANEVYPATGAEVRRNKAINSKVLQKDPTIPNLRHVQSRVAQESLEHGDVLQGSFVDSPRNSSYKHVMGLKWVSEELEIKPVFLIKTEDDVFVEVFHLVKFVTAIYGESPTNSLVCDVVPQGGRESYGQAGVGVTDPFAAEGYPDHVVSDVVSTQDDGIEMSEDRRRSDDGEQGAMEVYPEHCGKMAFLMTPDLAGRFLEASRDILPTETTGTDSDTSNSDDDSGDVYVTGLLRESLRVRPFYLNLRFAHDETSYLRWLQGPSRLPLPFLFAAIDAAKAGWQGKARGLWAKTVGVHEGGRVGQQ